MANGIHRKEFIYLQKNHFYIRIFTFIDRSNGENKIILCVHCKANEIECLLRIHTHLVELKWPR